MAIFRYEQLLDFCYVCGKLDHQELDCEEVVKINKEWRKVHREYGSWMRADGPVLLPSKLGKQEHGSMGDIYNNLPAKSDGGQYKKMGLKTEMM